MHHQNSQIIQFTDFNDTVETLFSLLNGDDIYNTYILLDPEVDLLAYIYSRIFLYVFLGLFIYAVLNLFTSLIIVAHEISQVIFMGVAYDDAMPPKYRTRTLQWGMK